MKLSDAVIRVMGELFWKSREPSHFEIGETVANGLDEGAKYRRIPIKVVPGNQIKLIERAI